MKNARTICLVLLIPLLLELLTFFAVLPARNGSRAQVEQGCEEVFEGFQGLEEWNETEEDFSTDALQVCSQLANRSPDFRQLIAVPQPSVFIDSRAIGWKMPLRI